MTEKPISLPDWKVRALPHATQIRVVMRLDALGDELDPDDIRIEQHKGKWIAWFEQYPDEGHVEIDCPYPVGAKLWVREAWHSDESDLVAARAQFEDLMGGLGVIFYRSIEGHVRPDAGWRWRSARTMPRWMSRFTLEVTGVKAERLQEISEEDAKAEGVKPLPLQLDSPGSWWTADVLAGPALHGRTPKEAFALAYDSTAKPGEKWADSPWAWVLTVKTLEGV